VPTVIDELLAAWYLFAPAWICAWLLAPLLGLVGAAMVARGAIFQGVATAQVSTAAVALMLVLTSVMPWCGTTWAIGGVAMLVAVAASIMAISGRTSEIMNGWLFLASCAATPLLLAHTPHGLADAQRLITSSLIGATWWNAGLFGSLLVICIMLLWRFGATIRLVLLDREFAADLGMDTVRWQTAIGLSVGIAVGLGLSVAGLLFVAGCLLLPTLAAVHLVRTVGQTIWVAPVIALLAALAGTLLSHLADLPLGQVVVGILAVTVATTRLLRRWIPSASR